MQGIASGSPRTKQHQAGFGFKTRLGRLDSSWSREQISNYRFNIGLKVACPSERSHSTTALTDARLTFGVLDRSTGRPAYLFSSINSGSFLQMKEQAPDGLRLEIHHTLKRSPSISLDFRLPSVRCSDRALARQQLEQRLQDICVSLFTKPKRPGKDIDAVLALEEVSQKESPEEFDSRLCDIATRSQLHSKMVQHYLKSMRADQALRLLASFGPHIRKLLWDEFGHHVLRSSIQISPALADDCQQVCEASFAAVAKCSYSVSVAKKLASIRPCFCEFGLKFFQDNLLSTVSDPSAQILLSSLITNAPREELLLFLLPSLEQSLAARRADCPLMRVLSILIDRLTGSCFVEKAALVSLPHLAWMIDDPTGNYAIQSFIKKNSPIIVKKLQKICLKQPELLITNKYRRYVLLGLLEAGGHEAFVTKALLEMSPNKEAVHAMLANKRNIHLFFFALLVAEGFDRGSFEQVCSNAQAWGSSHSRTSGSSEWRLLSTMIACLRLRDYANVLGLLSRTDTAG